MFFIQKRSERLIKPHFSSPCLRKTFLYTRWFSWCLYHQIRKATQWSKQSALPRHKPAGRYPRADRGLVGRLMKIRARLRVSDDITITRMKMRIVATSSSSCANHLDIQLDKQNLGPHGWIKQCARQDKPFRCPV